MFNYLANDPFENLRNIPEPKWIENAREQCNSGIYSIELYELIGDLSKSVELTPEGYFSPKIKYKFSI